MVFIRHRISYNKLFLALIILFFGLIVFSGCVMKTNGTKPHIKYGNTMGNIINEGIVAENGEWIYFNVLDGKKGNNPLPSFFKVKKDGTGETKLQGFAVRNVNIVDDWIYFTPIIYHTPTKNKLSIEDQFKIYKMKTDGTGLTKVSDESANNLIVKGDWFYYVRFGAVVGNNEEIGKIFRLKKDGTMKTKLSDDIYSENLILDGDYLYYLISVNSTTRKSNLYRMKTDGSEKSKMELDNIKRFVIDRGWIYYINGDDQLYKIKTNLTQKTKLVDGKILTLNIDDGWIYYTSILTSPESGVLEEGFGDLYKIRTDGTGKTLIDAAPVWAPCVVDDWIYYYNVNKQLYIKIKKDGSKEAFLSAMDR